MPFNPAWPQNGQNIDADRFRDQFGGLKDLIDAVPAGPPGAPGVPGPPFADAVVEAVTTVPAGGAATVSVFFDGTNVRFTFGIPQGEAGAQGPAFANALIDSVNTLNPGESATVSVFYDGSNVRFTFGIPRGAVGEQGIQGLPGEVTNAVMTGAIATAIAGTSNVTNAVATLDTPFANDPPTLADMELLRAKMNEMLLAMRR